MIASMTAFSRSQIQGDWGQLVCEIRSINHRFLEVSVYMPESLRALEMTIREKIRQMMQRGKIECTLRLKLNAMAEGHSIKLNTSLAKALAIAAREVSDLMTSPAPIPATDILKMPGVIEVSETDLSQLQSDALKVVETSLNELMAARQREGEGLTRLLLERTSLLEQELQKVKARLPTVLSEQREKLQKRFEEVKLELDPGRLEQEMVLFAQRMDVAEELDRTETHLTEIRRVLKAGGVAGRRLDFLMQELNREANTLGSKSTDTLLTHAAVEMKVLIEQMREQVQNIE